MMITTRTHTVKSIAAHSIHMVVLLIFAVISTHSFFYNLKYIQGTENIIIEIITASLATLLWGVLYFEVRALTAVLYADNSGIGIRRFGKTKVYLKWSDICEIGVGKIPTPYGYAERVYLSSKKLSDSEKNDLITIRFHTVYFSYIPMDFADMIQRKCNLSLPSKTERKYCNERKNK